MDDTNKAGRAMRPPGYSTPKLVKKAKKIDKPEALGQLLVEIVQLQRELISLLKDGKGSNIDFIKSIWYIALSILYEIGKWLSHCLLFAI